jgi:preprotein translocase subunit YajC
MTLILSDFSLLLAADPAAPQSPFGMFVPLILMFVMFYFILIRPQRKKQKELALQISSIKKDDRVITIGGMHGMVANVKETTVILKIADNVRAEFEKSAVATIIKKERAGGETAPVADEAAAS